MQGLRAIVVGWVAVSVVGIAVAGVTSCKDGAPARPPAGPNAVAVTFTSEPPGANVFVDGIPLGPAPQTVPLNPGPHRVRATLSGYYPSEEKRIVVGAAEARSHQLTLVASH